MDLLYQSHQSHIFYLTSPCLSLIPELRFSTVRKFVMVVVASHSNFRITAISGIDVVLQLHVYAGNGRDRKDFLYSRDLSEPLDSFHPCVAGQYCFLTMT